MKRIISGSNIAANLDPSHLFWQQMDPLAVAERLGPLVAHGHAKDVAFNAEPLALNGLLDHRWSSTDANGSGDSFNLSYLTSKSDVD